MKKFIAALIAGITVSACAFGGCVNISGVDGKDGKDGSDVSIYQIYEATNEERKKQGLSELDFLEFVSEYLGYTGEDLQSATSLQASINRSLMCGVSVAAGFPVTTRYQSYPWGPIETKTETKWYFGAGVILDMDFDRDAGNAYIVTNCHVIYNDTADTHVAESVYLFLYGQDADYDIDNCAIKASVVGASRSYDIALLKVENDEVLKNSNAQCASFIADDDMYVGESVYAVGNPEGYGISATQGIISKESETISINLSSSNKAYTKNFRVLRTDAAINGGNSGGGLFNTAGQLVGIVNAKAASEDIDNMGYALPASNVKRLVKLMLDGADGDITETGVYVPKLQAEYEAKARPSKYSAETNRVEIMENVYVVSDGDGLLANDSINHIKILDTEGNVIEDKDVTRLYHVDDTLMSARRGYTVILTVSREGQSTEVSIELSDMKYFATTD